MKSFTLNNSYALLGLFLSPQTDEEHLSTLREAIQKERISWEALLYQANLNYCTPLWYVRLRQKNLLFLIPAELRKYLQLLHEANTDRNAAFRRALGELLVKLHERDIPSVLLKGAATFCDDLYRDGGARMMGDLDILIAPQHLEAAQMVTAELGYREGPHPGYSHHLPRLHLPDTPVAVEIHFRLGRGQDDRSLPPDLAWRCREETVFEGIPTSILDPTRRLLHNTVHALIPKQMFIRSDISLRDVMEFAALAHRHGPTVRWREWFESGSRNGLGAAFNAYLGLACRLTGMRRPMTVPVRPAADSHVARILLAGKYLGHLEKWPANRLREMKRRLVKLWVHIYYHAALPLWRWRNPCYAQGVLLIPRRLLWLGRQYLRGERKTAG
jgi:hypothetical protein